MVNGLSIWSGGRLKESWTIKGMFLRGGEKAMAPHSSTLAWNIPWTEEPGRLQSMRSWRVRNDWATSLSLFSFMHWRRKWHPTPVFLPGESQGRGTWWAAVYGVAQSRTRLKRLSSSSSSSEICIHPQQQKRWTKVKAATIYLMEMKGQSDREYASTTFYFLALVSLFYLVFRLTFHAGI